MQGTAGPDSEQVAAKTATAPDGKRALRQRLQEFVTGWRRNLTKEWHAERASALHEDLEKLVSAAEEQGARDVADPALELTVYLCSFVDGGSVPSAAQRQELEQLIGRLSTAAGETPVRRTAAADAATRAGQDSHRRAFYLRPSERELPGLAAYLGNQGYIVKPFESCEQVLLALEEISPDLLLVDDSFVAEVHALVEAMERQRQTHKDPPLCIVLAEDADLTRVLFAQRAGAEAVISLRDPIAIVARIEELSAQRRALGYRVLIVEDDRAQAKFCESILRHRGMITSVCAEPGAMLAAVDEFKPDLVLLDLYLPGGNGIDLAQQLRAHAAHAFLPIVLLSGEHDQDLRFDAIRMGADDFITKPVKPRHLVMTVESRVRRARELSSGQAATIGGGDRRGAFSGRDVFARELLRAAREEQERCPAVAMIALDARGDVRRIVGFEATGALSKQIAAALGSELHGSRTLCAHRELQFLALLHAGHELALREQIEGLRANLDARQWLSSESQLRLRFSIGCLRLGPDTTSVDAVLDRLQALCDKADAAGGGRCEFDLRAPTAPSDEDPQQRLIRVILRATSVKGTAQFAFLPLIPLAGQLTGQYSARMELKPPKSKQARSLGPEIYRPIAASLGLLPNLERHQVRAILDTVHESGARPEDLRLFLQISVASLLDPAFAPWLAAELRGHGMPSTLLSLEVSAEELYPELTRAGAALEALQRVGARLALDLGSAMTMDLKRLIALDSVGILKFRRPVEAKPGWDAWSAAIGLTRSLGKIVVATDVAGMGEVAQLLRFGVHYAQGEPLSGWLDDFSFDFAEATI